MLSPGKKNPHLSKSLYKHIYTLNCYLRTRNIVLNTKQLFANKAIDTVKNLVVNKILIR